MIEFVRGEIADLKPTQIVIDCNSIGYLLYISLNTYSAVQGKKNAKLFVYEAIREDAYLLFGFASQEERSLFLLLLSVSGIGGQTARMILSAYSPNELCDIIGREDDKLLKSIKGIGPKAAQRIIVELKDKIATVTTTVASSAEGGPATGNIGLRNEVASEATAALTMLGFVPNMVQKAVTSILKSDPNVSVEGVIKQALKML